MNKTSLNLIKFNLIKNVNYNNKVFLLKSLEFIDSIFYFNNILLNLEIATIWLKILKCKNAKILFIGTMPSINLFVKKEAIRSNCFYVHNSWIGGTLTNWKYIQYYFKNSINELTPLMRHYEGILDMKGLPDIAIIINPDYEINAVKECNKLNIPIITIKNMQSFNNNLIIPGSNNIEMMKIFIQIISNKIINK
jgi:small subunit ribosomal protein S2